MSELDPVHEAIEVLEWNDGKQGIDDTPQGRLRALTRRGVLTGGAAGLVATALAACGKSSPSNSKAQSGGGSPVSKVFGASKKMKFVFVNHVTTNSFFVPTKYGAQDACTLLGCSYQWTGSETSNVSEMVNAMNSAITSGANGIAVALIDKAFNGPTESALKAKIPVVAYNADFKGNSRLSYIGQDLFLSGQEMGKRIAQLVPSGDVVLFIATPGAANIQPRIDGAKSVLKSHSSIRPHAVATGAAQPAELTAIDSYAAAHGANTKGYFAVDAGSTAAVAQTVQKHNLRSKGVKGGGFDTLTQTIDGVANGQIDFTIDQQPYLQGFFPVVQLFLYQVSQSLSGIGEVNTGLKFVDKTTVGPYKNTKSRFEGSSSSAGVTKA